MACKKQIDNAWEKAKPIQGKNPNEYRKDPSGNVIRKASYGTLGKFGWEIDHKKPKSKGGTDNPRNIQPLHWKNNRQKSDNYPSKKKK